MKGSASPDFQGQAEAGPKVSIITICRNEKLIEETCRSVVAQVFDDFEWLVIDGASTDGTLEVLERYRAHMSYFISEPDDGRYQAMNKGLQAARGEYLLFLNGGDALAGPLVLERLFRYETDNRVLAPLKPALKADIVFGEMVSRETGFLPWPAVPMGRRRPGLLYFKMYSLPHQATFIRKSLFEKIGPYDTRYKVWGDYEWFMRALLRWRASYEYVPLVVSIYNFESVGARAASITCSPGDVEGSRAYLKYALNPLVIGSDLIGALRTGILSGLLSLARLFLPPVLRRRLWQSGHCLAARLFRSSY
jgi:glycosyltransferase involved in cell wall biosynthesis